MSRNLSEFYILKFQHENGVIYTSNDEISSYNLKKLLKEIVKDCKPGIKIVVLYGIHGAKDGTMGNHDNNLVRCFNLAIEHVNEEPFIHEKEVSIESVILDTSTTKSIKNHDEMMSLLFGTRKNAKL